MALIVEDGTGLPDANSYVTLDEVREYASNRGITLPSDDAELEQNIHLVMDWFESYTFPSARFTAEQALSFPRDRITVDGILYTPPSMPPIITRIICEAVSVSQTIDLAPNVAGSANGMLKRKKIDVLEKEWFAPTGSWDFLPKLPKLDAMMQKLCYPDGFGNVTILRA